MAQEYMSHLKNNPPQDAHTSMQAQQEQIAQLQQQMATMKELTAEIADHMASIDVITTYTHHTLHRQQNREVANQTVLKPWPEWFTDEDRNQNIH